MARPKDGGEEAKRKVVFRHIQDPGHDLEFSYEGKQYRLVDGMAVELPQHIIDHLEKNCRYPVMQWVKLPDGTVTTKRVGWTRRFLFEDFIPGRDDDVPAVYQEITEGDLATLGV